MNEPAAYRFKSPLSEEGQWEYGKEPPVGSRWEIEKLYPKRTWVGLTGEELRDIARSFKGNTQRRFADHWDEIKSFVDEIEAKLKERNT
jgi:hypothetical protein